VWQVYKRTISRSRDMKVFENMRLRCYRDSTVAGLMIYTGGLYDYDEMKFVRRYLRPSDGFLDIGANIGVYTLLAASIVGAEGFVDAFEPGIIAAERLRENVALNALDNVRVHEVAVAEVCGTIRFLQDRDAINRIAMESEGTSQATDVACIALDEFADRTYAMGKIDVEGTELLAFRGGTAMFRATNPPVWLLEMKDYLLTRFGFSPSDLEEWLNQHGYELAFYDADRETLDFQPELWRSHSNVIAVARAARDMVCQRLVHGKPYCGTSSGS
jgi:FkbM family methyltransferase